MSRSLRIVGMLLFCLVLLAVPGCDNDDDNWGQVGMVIDSTIGCWLIVVGDIGSEDAAYYEPTNLNDHYKVHGLWVRFEYVLPEEWGSICMVGDVIDLTRIEEL